MFGRAGDLVTMIIGSRRGRKYFSIYLRDHDEEDAATDNPLTTRFEARLRYRTPLGELQSIANPFAGVQVCLVSPSDPDGLSLHERLFLDSVRLRRSHAALRRLGSRSETRRRYRDLLYEHFNFEPWNPDSIWRGWERALVHVAYPRFQPRRRLRIRRQ